MTAATQAGTLSAEVRLGGVPYPLALGPGGIPAPIDVAPQVAFPDAIILGDSSRRSDQRVASVIQSDWTGGIGTMDYIESQGVDTVRDSFVDTRFPGMLVSSRRETWSFSVLTGAPLSPGQHIEFFTSSPTTVYLAWAKGVAPSRYDRTTGLWGSAGTFLPNGFAWFNNRAVFSTTTGIFTSPDGSTWTQAPGMATNCTGVTHHDNKLWTIRASDNGLVGTSDVTAATWTVYITLQLQAGEIVMQLFDWRNARGARALYVLTNQRIIGYDDDDREFSTFFDCTDLLSASPNALPAASVWSNNDDLYVTFFDPNNTSLTDTVIHFNGSVVEVLSPNKRGGLLPADQFSLLFLRGSENFLYAFAGRRAKNVTGGGRILAMNAQQGWHTMAVGTDANPIVGGGYAAGMLIIVRKDGTVTGLETGDGLGTPLTVGSTVDYATVPLTVESAYLDGGTPGIAKRLLWVRVNCLVRDNSLGSQFGLPVGATVKVEYRIDNGPWTALTAVKVNGVVSPLTNGVLDSGVAFPAMLPLGNELGVSCTRWAWRLSLTAATGGAGSPIVSEVSWHYIRQPEVRYSYRVRVDLRDEQWGGEALPQFGGKTAAQLRQTLLSWPGKGLTTFSYGRGAAAVNLSAVDVVVRPVESAWEGLGLYDVVVRDLSTPNSGV